MCDLNAAKWSKAKRDRNRAAGLCINSAAHAKPIDGASKCDDCLRKARRNWTPQVRNRLKLATFTVVLERTGETFTVAHTNARPVWR